MSVGVLFDMDGVLVASGPAHQASWRIVARRRGCEVSDAQFRETFGRTSRDIVRILFGADLSEAEVLSIDRDKEAAYRELISGLVPLMIGCREVLAALAAARFPLAVATSGPPENVELVLRETGIGKYFDASVTGADVEHGKPAPDCFLLAARRLGLPPSKCVVVEDAPAGIAAGLAAGARVIGLAGTHPPPILAQAGATQVVERLSQVTPALVTSLVGAST